jgi:hypothetical protein
MPRDYSYDQGFSEERARLASMESLWDPRSRAAARGGSLVNWMAGRGATVLAIDIDTRFVERLDRFLLRGRPRASTRQPRP